MKVDDNLLFISLFVHFFDAWSYCTAQACAELEAHKPPPLSPNLWIAGVHPHAPAERLFRNKNLILHFHGLSCLQGIFEYQNQNHQCSLSLARLNCLQPCGHCWSPFLPFPAFLLFQTDPAGANLSG